ncbi:PatB family C-S lyase, partial [Telmatospirillum sp.]|uniref:MalY/PatB family protein n=1 Tax=Telmatospirillum sp. TaxID=2079197 RepID=UPI00284E1D3D
NWDIEEEWVEYTPAVVPALVYAISAYTHPGDAVLIQTPVYHPFHHMVVNNGRTKLESDLVLRDGRYYIDFDDLERKLSNPRTRLMLLCSPHNPIGRVFTPEELLRVGELCAKHHVVVLCDEIHSDILYGGRRHTSFATLSDQIGKNCVVCVNPSKTFNIAGVRTAAAIIPDKKLRDDFHTAVLNHKGEGRTVFGTLLFETAYDQCEYYVDELVEYLQGNVDFIRGFFAEKIRKIALVNPEATYLVWLDCRALGMSQPNLVKFMLEEAKVAMSDGETFGAAGRGFMRMNIGCRRATLQEALGRIERAVNALPVSPPSR